MSSEFEMVFTPFGTYSATSSVQVRGSWDGNKTATAMHHSPDSGRFTARLALAPGTYTFRFLIDGKTWRCSPEYAMKRRGDGSTENKITIRKCMFCFEEFAENKARLAGVYCTQEHFICGVSGRWRASVPPWRCPVAHAVVCPCL